MSAGRIILDWRKHKVSKTLKPCRICAKPALMCDEHDRPCHKTCAEDELAARSAEVVAQYQQMVDVHLPGGD